MSFSWHKTERSLIRPAFYTLFFNGEELRKIGYSVIGGEKILREIKTNFHSQQEIEKEIELQEEKHVFSLLIRELSSRAMTEHEARKFLDRHYTSENGRDKVIERVKGLGYISDEIVIESLIRKYAGAKKSCRDIEMRLQRRVGKKIDIDSLLPTYEHDKKSLQELILKKFSKQLSLAKDDIKKQYALIGMLVRKGFSYDLIRDVLGEMKLRDDDYNL